MHKKIKANSLFMSESEIFNLEFSVGHATYPNDGKDIDQLIKVADSRMYEHKRNKKQNVA